MSKNGYTRVGKMDGQDIYQRVVDRKIFKEADCPRELIRLTPGEREQFEKQKLKFALDK